MTLEVIFIAAVEKAPADRAAYLDAVCRGDAGLRGRVEALLRSHEEAGSVLEQPLFRPEPTADHPPAADRPGGMVGPYKLVQEIGEGGMGTVFLAQQQAPVKRLVALKVIKAGMDSRQVLARFEAERQALALMDHHNIAKVLDAGTTADGRPYFVMELVKGVPITRYCDEKHLTPRERLELFVQVCHAVQHAHQKGVIHRDLKPSNVLVAPYDGRPVVKVIDFGVAKAAGQPLTEKTLVTGFGAVVGTPEYMSPEQAELNNADVDTRSDIYSLGVLLYELLTGSTPLTNGRLKERPLLEVLRLVREEEPARPSTRLSTTAELPSIAANRGLEPRKLSGLVRGELDWVVMKALEKDRNRRYETAHGFAADVRNYLDDLPVLACPPSLRYRAWKFARRNRAAMLPACLVALGLIAGLAGTTWGMVRAESERRAAEENERKALAAATAQREAKETAEAREAATRSMIDFIETRIFAAARPLGQDGGLGRDVTLLRAVEAAQPYLEANLAREPVIQARLRNALGVCLSHAGEAAKAAEQFEKARDLFAAHAGDDEDALRCASNLAVCYSEMGRYDEARKLQEKVLEAMTAGLGGDHPDTLRVAENLANTYSELARHADALKLRKEILRVREGKPGPEHPDTLRAMHNLANSYASSGRGEDALKLREKTLPLMEKYIGPDDPDTLRAANNLANSYDTAGRHHDALKLHKATLAARKDKLGAGHSETLQSMNNLSVTYAHLRQHKEALALREQAAAFMREKPGVKHPETLRAMSNLAFSYSALKQYDDALKLFEETVALRKVVLTADHPDTLLSMWGVADTLVELGRGAEAVPIIDDCFRRAEGRVVDPRLLPGVALVRLAHFAKEKDAAGCRATAEMWEKLGRTDAESLYTAARLRAVTAGVLARDSAPDAAEQAGREAERAVAWLGKAVAAGLKDPERLRKDRNLRALGDRDDFRKLVAESAGAEKKGNH